MVIYPFDSKVFVVTVNFEIYPEHLESFLGAVKEQAINSMHLELQCQQFDVSQSEKEPCMIFLYEIYTNEAAFDAHLKSAHFAQFNTTTTPWIKHKSVSTWTRL